jgi:hypothetical protein
VKKETKPSVSLENPIWNEKFDFYLKPEDGLFLIGFNFNRKFRFEYNGIFYQWKIERSNILNIISKRLES